MSPALRGGHCASVPLLLGPAEDERGGAAPGRETHGLLPKGGARGGGQALHRGLRWAADGGLPTRAHLGAGPEGSRLDTLAFFIHIDVHKLL